MKHGVRVKFCGFTNVEDVRAAVALGVDAIGLVFVPASKRRVGIGRAQDIVAAVPPFVTTVGLFLDAPADEVARVLAAVPLDLLQFHGSEPPEQCAAFGRPYLKALAMGDGIDAVAAASRYAGARGILLDAHRSGEQGGSGLRFDWSRIPPELAPRIVLAGGLAADNVAAAIAAVHPYAVDVASGIESAPGQKCPARMQAFMNEVERAARESRPG
ncbi:MAG: N-(5'-phosphoribosyl)anthranilate isomerase [Lysobacterales bacterium]|nr:N-(5'-phosphoribosyl)anthranilate isomerase [Xanthomonadales bacterium]